MFVSAILWTILGSIVVLGVYAVYDEKIAKRDKTDL
jgi:hypothetical protein